VAEPIVILIIVLVFRFLLHGHHIGRYEKAGTGIDERLKDVTSAFEKTSVHLQSIFDLIKNRKK
jgi:hypothetical protein